jgi:hypothetical protein
MHNKRYQVGKSVVHITSIRGKKVPIGSRAPPPLPNVVIAKTYASPSIEPILLSRRICRKTMIGCVNDNCRTKWIMARRWIVDALLGSYILALDDHTGFLPVSIG